MMQEKMNDPAYGLTAELDKPEMTDIEQRLQALAQSLLKKRDEAVEGRAASGIERQWREDQAAFDGKEGENRTDMIDFATGDAFIDRKKSGPQQRRSRVVVNIIRGKCDTAEGRFTEILLPTDDRNWGIKPSPISEEAFKEDPKPAGQMLNPPPTMPQAAAAPMQQGAVPQSAQMGMAQVPGSPMPIAQTPEDKAKQANETAKKRSVGMQDVIDDQLEECGFNGECRKVVRSAVRLGTGVLKGPNVVKTVRRAWQEITEGADSAYVMKVVEKLTPASTWRDIWNIYPDPNCGSDPKRGAYIWDRDYTLPRELEALIGMPGYQSTEIIKVLREVPKRTTVAAEKDSMRMRAQTIMTERGAPYERWEYHGDVDREDLEAMGCRCPEGIGFTFSACVVFVNDHPIKVQLNTIDTGELPYDFFQWVQQDNDSPWGIGEPRKLIWQQRIITAAWRSMMDNAGDSAGAQVVVSKDMEPEDGIWEVTGKKIWVDEREDGDVRAAFAQYQIQNNQPELQNIIELALKFTDLESGTPALAQGEKGSAPETLGGMQMLMNGADTGRRRQVKQWDDQITRPHIGRYYHWNMQYNKRRDIKGDFEVDARGTSVLLVKDENAKMLLQLLQLRNDPEVEIQVDWSEAIRQLLQALHLDVLKPTEEVDALRKQREQAPPQVAPQVQAAQIRAESSSKDLQQRLAAEQAAAQQATQATAQEKDKDRQLALLVAQMTEHIEGMKLTGDQETSFVELKAMLASTTMKLNTQRELSYQSGAIDMHKHNNPPPVMTPPTEPAGQAQDGMAYQQ